MGQRQRGKRAGADETRKLPARASVTEQPPPSVPVLRSKESRYSETLAPPSTRVPGARAITTPIAQTLVPPPVQTDLPPAETLSSSSGERETAPQKPRAKTA